MFGLALHGLHTLVNCFPLELLSTAFAVVLGLWSLLVAESWLEGVRNILEGRVWCALIRIATLLSASAYAYRPCASFASCTVYSTYRPPIAHLQNWTRVAPASWKPARRPAGDCLRSRRSHPAARCSAASLPCAARAYVECGMTILRTGASCGAVFIACVAIEPF